MLNEAIKTLLETYNEGILMRFENRAMGVGNTLPEDIAWLAMFRANAKELLELAARNTESAEDFVKREVAAAQAQAQSPAKRIPAVRTIDLGKE
jgi:hypothetical protein